MDEEFVGAQREACREQHSTFLFGDRLCALPLTALDFLQELQGGSAGELPLWALNSLSNKGQSHSLRTPAPTTAHQVLEQGGTAVPRDTILQRHGIVHDLSCALPARGV